MARIAGINIPTNKHVGIALTHIFGIGRNRAAATCKAAEVNPTTQVKDLTEAEVDPVARRDREISRWRVICVARSR